MRHIVFELAGGMACALFLAVPLAAANTTLTKSAAKTTEPPRSVWPAENLTGKITMVYPSRHLIVVNHLGVPFDMIVGRNTRIESGNQTLTLDQLSSTLNKDVAVHFVPERAGDIAVTINLQG